MTQVILISWFFPGINVDRPQHRTRQMRHARRTRDRYSTVKSKVWKFLIVVVETRYKHELSQVHISRLVSCNVPK